MDFTDVPMLKIWPILADTDTDINIGASLLFITEISPYSLFKFKFFVNLVCLLFIIYLYKYLINPENK